MSKNKVKNYTIAPLISLEKALAISLCMLKEIGIDDFLDKMLRNESLIIQNGDDKKIAWVKDFLAQLHHGIKSEVSVQVADSVLSKLKIIEVVNDYFSKIIEWRGQTEAVKTITPVGLVSAALVRGADDYLAVSEKTNIKIKEYMGADNYIDSQKSYLIEDSKGVRVLPDDAFSSIFDSIFLILKTTGYLEGLKKGNYFDYQDFLTPDDEALYKVAALNLNAMSWNYFDTLQKDIRHCKRDYQYFADNSEVPDEHKDAVNDHLYVGLPSSWRAYEVIAEHRLRQLSKEMYINAYSVLKGGLKKKKTVQAEKVANIVVIEKILSLDPYDERNKCLGLTLAQWLDGYAALQEYVRDGYKEDDLYSLIPMLERNEIKDVLLKSGMLSGVADVFIDNVTFGLTSIDLYDTPLIRFGSLYMIYGPALKEALLHALVISNVSRNKEKLSRKGDALEEKLFSIFESFGLQTKKIKERRGGEEYQFDVVVKWDDVLFVFECKNRAIPKSPILSRNMLDDYRAYLTQLSRLCEALRNHPDILTKYFGRDHGIKKIVPCLVNGMPFSFDESLNKTFVTDIVSIKRFFSEKEITFNYPSGEVSVYSQWMGDTPCLDDFLFHLANPHQVELKRRYLTQSDDVFFVGGKSIVRVNGLLYEEEGFQDAIVYFTQLSERRKGMFLS